MKTKGPYDFAAKRKQYRGYTMEQLRFAAQDCLDTINAWRPGHHPNEGWYLDDYHTIKDEIRRRLTSDVCETCGK